MKINMNVDLGNNTFDMSKEGWKNLEKRLFGFLDRLQCDASMNFMNNNGDMTITIADEDEKLVNRVSHILSNWTATHQQYGMSAKVIK